MKLLILFLFVLKLNLISCDSSCNTIKKCGECIGNPFDKCVWCAQNGLKEEFHQCESESNLTSIMSWCNEEFIVDPINSLYITRDADDDWTVGNNKVQFRPLEMNIKARPGEPVTFKASYKPVKNYPLDVYFLIHNSFNNKMEVKKQVYDIFNQLVTYTNNVQFGFGTSIEKTDILHFNNRSQNNVHSFEHQLSFTTNFTLFSNVINNTTFGANFSDSEGGLDALMQVMVCDKELEWRKNSKRFIVLFTDSIFHSAGEGKIIGLIKPNDMECHLENNKYAMSLKYDYPSIRQITKVAHDGAFNIIFASTDDVRPMYEALARVIGSASYTKLESNIADLIVDQYKTAVATIDLEAHFPSFIDIKIEQDCKATSNVICGSTRDKPQVDLKVTLTVKSCQNIKNPEVFIGALSDKLKINIEIYCDCKFM